MLPLLLLAKYPFLPGAADYVAQHGPSLEELLQDRAYERARGRGVARLAGALERAEVEPATVASEPEALVEMLSYGVARMLTAGLKLPWAARRSAMAEAKLAHARLVEESPEVVREVAALLGLRLRRDAHGAPRAAEGAVAVHVADYLRHAAPLKEPGWKLVNQPLRKGFVELDARRLARLCQEAVRQRIEAAARQEPPEEVEEAFRGDLAALKKLADEQMAKYQGGSLGPVRLDLMPPCMKKLLAQLQGGVNVAHTGRFAVTSFLHNVGMDSEGIIQLFSQAPDFREDLTRYQVEHITGKTSSTEYTPPGCATLVTYSHCPMEELPQDQRDRYCVHPRMTHPLTYYRWAVNDARRAAPQPPPPQPPQPQAPRDPATPAATSASVPARAPARAPGPPGVGEPPKPAGTPRKRP